jgi:esterase/lipase superfamily enzyme
MYKRVKQALFALIIISLTACTGLTKKSTKEYSSSDTVYTPQSMVSPIPKRPISQKQRDTLYKLYYGTNRKPNNLNNFSEGYSDKRAKKLYTGTCSVHIPASHKRGKIDGSIWGKLIHWDKSYGDIVLKKIEGYKTTEEFWDELKELFRSLEGKKEALIFIHGYNNSFEKAARRAAQIGFDLNIKGVMAFYSWPSKNKISKYSSDEATIQASEKYIKEFIRGFAQKSGATKVHIIAHSMGNRGLLRVIHDIANETPSVKFGQIILAAPDVDSDLFEHISDAYTKLSDRTTLYISSDDKAVSASQLKHDSPRVGVADPHISIVNKIDTIKVKINFSSLFDKYTSLSHSYFAEENEILKDMQSLLNSNTKPEERPYIKRVYSDDKNKYWWSFKLN